MIICPYVSSVSGIECKNSLKEIRAGGKSERNSVERHGLVLYAVTRAFKDDWKSYAIQDCGMIFMPAHVSEISITYNRKVRSHSAPYAILLFGHHNYE